MKIVRYDDDRIGLLRDGGVIDVSDVVPKAVIDPGGTVVLSREDANIFHHEAELVAVIGRTAAKVGPDGALGHIFG